MCKENLDFDSEIRAGYRIATVLDMLSGCEEENVSSFEEVLKEVLVDACMKNHVVYVNVDDEGDGKCSINGYEGKYGAEVLVIVCNFDDDVYKLKENFKAYTYRDLFDRILLYKCDGIMFCKTANHFEDGIISTECSYDFIRKVVDEAYRSEGILDLNEEIRFIAEKIGCSEEDGEKFIDAENEYLEDKGVIAKEGAEEADEALEIDTDDMIDYISEHTGLDHELVEEMADAEFEFYEKVGITKVEEEE